MDLQTNELVDLRKLSIDIKFNTKLHPIHIRYVSKNKEEKCLEETKIVVRENQEVSLEIVENKLHQIEVKLPYIPNISYESDGIGKEYDIYKFDSGIDFPWSNGKYIFEVTIDGERHYALLNVVQKNIDSDEFLDMHSYLEEQLSGITRSFQDISETIDNGLLGNPSYLQLIHWFRENLNRLISSLTLIENSNESIFKKVYKMENIPKHMDDRSIQWAASPKGSIYSNKYYNRKSRFTVNTLENRYVKMNTLQIIFVLTSEINQLSKDIERIEEKSKETQQEIEKVNIEIEDSKVRRNISMRDTSGRKVAKSNLLREFEKFDSLIKELSDSRSIFQSSNKKLKNIIQNQFWSKISRNAVQRNMKLSNKNYTSFNILYKKFNKIKTSITKDEVNTQSHSHVLHPTSTLYEFYTYFKVAEVLTDIGFIKDHQSKEMREGILYSELLSNTKIQYKKGNKKISLVFDQEVQYASSGELTTTSYFFSRSLNRRPDIRVDLYSFDEEKKEYLYSSSIILEVKYRTLRNIYSDQGYFTKEMEQMDEYRKIRYYCNVRGKYLDEIEDVVCVYPSGYKHHFISEAGTYVRLRPALEREFKDIIKKKIMEWVNK